MAFFRRRPLAISRRRVIIKSPSTEGVRPLLSGGAYNFARWRLNDRKLFSRNVLRDAPAQRRPVANQVVGVSSFKVAAFVFRAARRVVERRRRRFIDS